MKPLFLAFFIFSLQASALNGSLNFTCKTKPETTSFQLIDEGDTVLLKLRHVNGTGYMPIHEGIIVPNDIDYLREKAGLLTQMGAFPEFRFPKSKCRIYGPKLFICSQGERKKFGKLEMQGLHIMSQIQTNEFMDAVVKTIRIAFDVHIPGHPPVQQISMLYMPEDCDLNF